MSVTNDNLELSSLVKLESEISLNPQNSFTVNQKIHFSKSSLSSIRDKSLNSIDQNSKDINDKTGESFKKDQKNKVDKIDQISINQIKNQQQHPQLESTQSAPTEGRDSKINSSAVLEQQKRTKPKSVSVSISAPVSSNNQPIDSNLNKRPPFNNQQNSNQINSKSSSSPLNSFLFSKFSSLTTSSSASFNQQDQQTNRSQSQQNKKTKKRRSFELFNSGIIRRQHSAQQSSQSSPGPTLNSTQQDLRRESISSAKQTSQQLPLSIIRYIFLYFLSIF